MGIAKEKKQVNKNRCSLNKRTKIETIFMLIFSFDSYVFLKNTLSCTHEIHFYAHQTQTISGLILQLHSLYVATYNHNPLVGLRLHIYKHFKLWQYKSCFTPIISLNYSYPLLFLLKDHPTLLVRIKKRTQWHSVSCK